jgi:hypothetical protein
MSTWGKAVVQMELYISEKMASSGVSWSERLSSMVALNCCTSRILGIFGLLLYHVLLCQRQTVMKSSRLFIVRKPLQPPMSCLSVANSNSDQGAATRACWPGELACVPSRTHKARIRAHCKGTLTGRLHV